MTTELSALPDSFSAGTTVSYRKSFSDYPASAGWTLTLHLAGVNILTKAAAADGDDFVLTLAAAETDTEFSAGLYKWVERVSNAGGEVYEVASGVVTVLSNLATATAGSEQEWLERAIVALKAHIEGRLPDGMQSFQVAGRAVSLIDPTDAVRLLNTFESRLARLANPDQVTRQVLTSFTGPGFDR